MAMPYPVLTKRTKISAERLMHLSNGAEPTEAEIETLAAVWLVPSEGLRESIAQAKDTE